MPLPPIKLQKQFSLVLKQFDQVEIQISSLNIHKDLFLKNLDVI